MDTVYIGADHAGFKLKEQIKDYLLKQGFAIEDLGNHKKQTNDDYPDYARKVGRAVVKTKATGILVCGTGHGMAIAANKIKGVRAAVVSNMYDAKSTRQEDHANVICLAGRFTTFSKAKRIVLLWLKTDCSKAKRHIRRVKKIKRLEQP